MKRAGLRSPVVWLDVEPVPDYDWPRDLAANAAVVRGCRARLHRRRLPHRRLLHPGALAARRRRPAPGLPEWRAAGQTSRAEALRRCGPDRMFQGGDGVIGQWVEAGRDQNVTCPGTSARAATLVPPVLRFGVARHTQGCHDDDPGGYTPGGGPYVPTGPPPPAYKDYWTPACSLNGPPSAGSADAMCMGAATICDTQGRPDAIYMRHYRQQISPTVGGWELVGSVCRGPDDPVQEEPQVTEEMVLDQAYAAAPRPSAAVQPGARELREPAQQLLGGRSRRHGRRERPGQPGRDHLHGHRRHLGLRGRHHRERGGRQGRRGRRPRRSGARLRQAGQLRHHRDQHGRGAVHAAQRPGGRPARAFEFSSDPVTLPVGEIQTRVDSTS